MNKMNKKVQSASHLWFNQLHHVCYNFLLRMLDDVFASGFEDPLHLGGHTGQYLIDLGSIEVVAELVHSEVETVATRFAFNTVVASEVPVTILKLPVAVVLWNVVCVESPAGFTSGFDERGRLSGLLFVVDI